MERDDTLLGLGIGVGATFDEPQGHRLPFVENGEVEDGAVFPIAHVGGRALLDQLLQPREATVADLIKQTSMEVFLQSLLCDSREVWIVDVLGGAGGVTGAAGAAGEWLII